MTGTTVERLAAHVADQRSKALETYRLLLLRNDVPHVGDEKLLSEVMATLGRQPADLAGDLEIAQGIAQREPLAAKAAEFEGEAQDAKKDLAAGVAEIEAGRVAFEQAARSKLAPLEKSLAKARSLVNEATRAGAELADLRGKWSALAAGV